MRLGLHPDMLGHRLWTQKYKYSGMKIQIKYSGMKIQVKYKYKLKFLVKYDVRFCSEMLGPRLVLAASIKIQFNKKLNHCN